MMVPLSLVHDGGLMVRRKHEPTILLVGPYDPKGGEYTFLAPPLGVWRLAGVLTASGLHADVFDPSMIGLATPAAMSRC